MKVIRLKVFHPAMYGMCFIYTTNILSNFLREVTRQIKLVLWSSNTHLLSINIPDFLLKIIEQNQDFEDKVDTRELQVSKTYIYI